MKFSAEQLHQMVKERRFKPAVTANSLATAQHPSENTSLLSHAARGNSLPENTSILDLLDHNVFETFLRPNILKPDWNQRLRHEIKKLLDKTQPKNNHDALRVAHATQSHAPVETALWLARHTNQR